MRQCDKNAWRNVAVTVSDIIPCQALSITVPAKLTCQVFVPEQFIIFSFRFFLSFDSGPIRTGERLLLTSFGYALSAALEKSVAMDADPNSGEPPLEWFLYPRDQLAWLDTNIEAMPREVRTAAEMGEQLNYWACDAYACGYLIKTLLAVGKTKELPSSSSASVLQKVAHGLLVEEKDDRLTAKQAQKMLECLLWGPSDADVPGWSSRTSLADTTLLSAWLDTKRAERLAAVSLKLCRFKISLEDFLHSRFLAEVSLEDLVDTHALLTAS